jgi:DNA-binding beta-propeller fold protein YncE
LAVSAAGSGNFLMRNVSYYLMCTLGLAVLTAPVAVAQVDTPKGESSSPDKRVATKTDDKADKAKETPAPPAKPAPVKYTELKKTLWPPKTGVKTPGVQIPMTKLKPEAEIALAAAAGSVLFTTDQVLISIPAADQIVRVEGRSNKVLEPLSGVAKPCGGLTNGFRNLWVVSCGSKGVARLETATGKSVAAIGAGAGSAPYAIVSSSDSVWVLSDDKTTLTRIDPDTNSIVSEVRLPASCRSISFAANSLWVACPGEKRIIRIDPQTNLVTSRIEVTPEPVSIAFGGATAAENSIWVLSRKEGKVARIDPKTNKVIATIDLGFTNADGNLAFGDGFVWVSAPGFPITKISTQLEKEKVVQQFVGDGGGMIQYGLNSVWLTNNSYNNVWRIDPKRIAATFAE